MSRYIGKNKLFSLIIKSKFLFLSLPLSLSVFLSIFSPCQIFYVTVEHDEAESA